MSDLREAAQQALEALDSDNPDIQLRAAIALRAALEQAEPEQEPAGWFEGPFGAFRANQLYKIAWPASTVAWSIPLYTAPPQRKPLTDAEIEKLFGGAVADVPRAHWLRQAAIEVVRKTEAAHGIGEKE